MGNGEWMDCTTIQGRTGGLAFLVVYVVVCTVQDSFPLLCRAVELLFVLARP
jgi:hypothetical protein